MHIYVQTKSGILLIYLLRPASLPNISVMTDYKEFIEAGSWVGRQQAFAIVASHASAAQAASLKEMRSSRAFERVGMTWDQFCPEYVGISRTHADRLIDQYDEFGETYFRLTQLARISPQAYRQIAGKIQDDVLEFEDEKIPLIASNVPKIRVALKKLRADLRTARVNAKERPPLTVKEFTMRVDNLAGDVHRAASGSQTATELQAIRAMCDYGLQKWKQVMNATSTITRT